MPQFERRPLAAAIALLFSTPPGSARKPRRRSLRNPQARADAARGQSSSNS